MITFLLNDTPIEVEECAPNLTILDWLRTKKGKMGTKEGCATGDCGACTILVGEEKLNSNVCSSESQIATQPGRFPRSFFLLLLNASGSLLIVRFREYIDG
mgnify:CR=1 FL=1